MRAYDLVQGTAQACHNYASPGSRLEFGSLRERKRSSVQSRRGETIGRLESKSYM